MGKLGCAWVGARVVRGYLVMGGGVDKWCVKPLGVGGLVLVGSSPGIVSFSIRKCLLELVQKVN